MKYKTQILKSSKNFSEQMAQPSSWSLMQSVIKGAVGNWVRQCSEAIYHTIKTAARKKLTQKKSIQVHPFTIDQQNHK